MTTKYGSRAPHSSHQIKTAWARNEIISVAMKIFWSAKDFLVEEMNQKTTCESSDIIENEREARFLPITSKSS